MTTRTASQSLSPATLALLGQVDETLAERGFDEPDVFDDGARFWCYEMPGRPDLHVIVDTGEYDGNGDWQSTAPTLRMQWYGYNPHFELALDTPDMMERFVAELEAPYQLPTA